MVLSGGRKGKRSVVLWLAQSLGSLCPWAVNFHHFFSIPSKTPLTFRWNGMAGKLGNWCSAFPLGKTEMTKGSHVKNRVISYFPLPQAGAGWEFSSNVQFWVPGRVPASKFLKSLGLPCDCITLGVFNSQLCAQWTSRNLSIKFSFSCPVTGSSCLLFLRTVEFLTFREQSALLCHISDKSRKNWWFFGVTC